ncbi:MAG: 3-deoxy-7-phosphoheptulonate synthase [Verrucomicrobiales bacterium]|nr:3-deoxy-7-phosphoheptulonate synthase [Verrucomicrobiales bacterium]
MIRRTENLRVTEVRRLAPPIQLKSRLAIRETANQTVVDGRETVQRILDGTDRRLLVVIGPCSIHEERSALEYAERLKRLSAEVADRLFVVMRVYFEKPRTTIGWKGLIYDPHLDGSDDVEVGLARAREIMLRINEMGLPAATEFLDPIVPQYLDDLVAWAAVGARTTESQTHRQMASGLSMPVGFKNSTDGSLQVALDAMLSARHPHSFLGIDSGGITSVVRTTGNPYGHLVLRGGKAGTNYDPASIAAAAEALKKAGLREGLMVDCSHANSAKVFARQEEVWNSVVEQRVGGNSALVAMMVESHLSEGNQSLTSDRSGLRYGVSITDACIGWETTERMLRSAAERMGIVVR